MGHNSAKYLHTVIEATKLSFADSLQYCADMDHVDVPLKQLLSKDYAAKRRSFIQPDRALENVQYGEVNVGDDTVYFCVVDDQGNACSFIISNYMHFGTGLVPKECGFTLHNRGANFSLQPGHANAIAPRKRPFHTIIPGMITAADTGALLAPFGVMGKFMQPQGQIQVLLSMSEFGMHPQQALDNPRFLVDIEQTGVSGKVYVEDGFSSEVIQKLRSMGHDIIGPVTGWARSKFGRGQVITRGDWWSTKDTTSAETGEVLLYAGSDLRGDGVPVGY